RPILPPTDAVDEGLIAAFFDGTLAADRRDDVARRIARDPSARWLLAETARFVEEVPAPVEAARAVVPGSARARRALRRVKTAIVICGTVAASLVVVFIPRIVPRFAGGGLEADWYAALSAGTPAAELVAALPRSAANVLGFVAAESPASPSFHAGVA